MATKDESFRDPEFEAAFNDDSAGGDAGGMNLEASEPNEGMPAEEAADAAETVSDDGGDNASVEAPVAVVVAEVEPGEEGAQGEQAGNDAAAQDAKAVNDEANAAASDNKSTAATTGEKEAGAEGSPGEEAAETPAAEAAEVAAGEGDAADAADPYDLSDVPPEDMQKAKSWVGRLKKLEADLKARASANGDKPTEKTVQAADDLEKVATEALGENNELADAADQAAADVASGKMTPDEARRRLADDFGEEFLGYIETIARDYAGQTANQAVGDRLGKVEQETQGVIDHLRNNAQRAHFQEIYDAHPDFVEVGEDPGFKEFAAAHGKEAVIDNGSAAAINELITEYKASKQSPAVQEQQAPAAAVTPPTAAPVDQNAADAAEGVRSAGLRLPDKPAKAVDDYKAAWDQF